MEMCLSSLIYLPIPLCICTDTALWTLMFYVGYDAVEFIFFLH